MGIKNWLGERWANATYIPPMLPEVERELKWRYYVGTLWLFTGIILLDITQGFSWMIFGIVLWDMVWTTRIATLGMSPKRIAHQSDKRWKKPKELKR